MARPNGISLEERKARLAALRAAMDAAGLAAVVIGSTKSLLYFTGLSWHPSERFTGAIVHVSGALAYVTPGFEREKVAGSIAVPGDILTWEEEENPFALIASRIKPNGRIGLDDQV